jgi:hypothetical protein
MKGGKEIIMDNMERIDNNEAATPEERVVIAPLTFELDMDGESYSVVDCDKEVITVTIPHDVNGLPVRAVGSRAFEYCDKLVSVVFPESEGEDIWEDRCLKEIGDNAFMGCRSLVTVTLPFHVDFIGHGAFYCCTSLVKAEFSEFAHISPYAFSDCSSLVEVTTPIGLPEGVFADCSSLIEAPISDGISTIGESAFARCNSLTSVTIPASVKCIESLAFRSCVGLRSVKFENPDGWYSENSYREGKVYLDLTNPEDCARWLAYMDFDDGVLWWKRNG